MQITKDKVVEIEYTLTVDGEVVDSTEDGSTLPYLHGHNNIIPGLEKALEGKKEGDKVQVTVQPEEGYGEHDQEAMQTISRDDFEDEVEVGETYFAQAEDGNVTPFTVVSVEGDNVTVDFNPPLAGKVLHFDVTIKSVRDADPEELEHGHPHMDGLEFDEDYDFDDE